MENGKPCPVNKGKEFKSFVNALKRQGYQVDWRNLKACDYGAPTIRKRLFLIARRDGNPIIWPDKTHGPGLKPYRTAAECIDWSDLGSSIFTRKRPLADNTMRRIAKGIKKYVLDSGNPFIVPIAHYNGSVQCNPIDEPLRTITASTKGGEFALVTPMLVGAGGPARAGEPKQANAPLGTVLKKNNTALVSAFLIKHFGGFYDGAGSDARSPFPTVLSAGRNNQNQLVTAYLMKMRGTNIGHGMDEPLHTITASGTHHAQVTAFLMKYYGTDQDPRIEDPLHTITTKDRFGLVTIHGEDYQIVDINMRMLKSTELAKAQGGGR